METIELVIGASTFGPGMDWSWSWTLPDGTRDGECGGELPRTQAPGEYDQTSWRRIAARIPIPGALRAAIRRAGGKGAAKLVITPDRIARFRWTS
jgi:hypothetical protein